MRINHLYNLETKKNMKKIELKLKYGTLLLCGYDINASFPWKKIPQITMKDNDDNEVFIDLRKEDVEAIISALQEILKTFPENKITAAMYEQAIGKMKHLFPQDFEMVRFKSEMALACSKSERLNILWIPEGTRHSNAFVCVGDINEGECECPEKEFEMNEIKGLERLRAKRFDIDF